MPHSLYLLLDHNSYSIIFSVGEILKFTSDEMFTYIKREIFKSLFSKVSLWFPGFENIIVKDWYTSLRLSHCLHTGYSGYI